MSEMFKSITRNRMTFKTLAVIAAALLVTAPITAQAATTAFGPMPVASIDNPLASSTTGQVFENVTGSIPNLRRSPWEGTNLAATGTYTSVSGNSSATYIFEKLMKSVSFVWGSPDTYNDFDIILSGSTTATVNGSSIAPPAAIGAKYVTLSDLGFFDTVTFRSTGNAFEFANLSTVAAVPLPAAGFLLLGGFGALAGLKKRKKS